MRALDFFQNFSTICTHMLSKFGNKSIQKSLTFLSKACFERSLFFVFLITFFSPFFCQANDTPPQAKVCLNMIVKNEKNVILRCLNSVISLIDYWVIVDTGSTDGTQQLIIDFMKEKGIKGELHERPWVNFSYNRNEALNLAKNRADYLLFIDADEYFEYEPGFTLPTLNKDFYYITIKLGGTIYPRVALVKTQLEWSWVGVLHEVLVSQKALQHATLEKVNTVCTSEGARSKDPQKYAKDAQVLETALKEEPNNSRYVFYLAQSYFDAENFPEALKNYEKRTTMGGWEEEVYYSFLRIGMIQEKLKLPEETLLQSYYKAYSIRKCRAEPLYYIVRYLREKNDFEKGYKIAKIAYTLPVPKDSLFIYQWVYDYGIAIELSVCAYWMGLYEESQHISLEVLKRNDLPSYIRTCVQKNLEFANAKIVENLLSKCS